MPSSEIAWIELRGQNAYCYYQTDSDAAAGKAIAVSKAITVDPNAPFVYAVLTMSDDELTFPPNAKLKISGPDGKTFGTNSNDENVFATGSGDSLQGLVIQNPAA